VNATLGRLEIGAHSPTDHEKSRKTPLCAARYRLNDYACAFATTTICTSECNGAGSAANRRLSPRVRRSEKAAAALASPALTLSR
jgi:hypothetical protein